MHFTELGKAQRREAGLNKYIVLYRTFFLAKDIGVLPYETENATYGHLLLTLFFFHFIILKIYLPLKASAP